VLYFGQDAVQRSVFVHVCNSGRDRQKAGKNGQRMGRARLDIAVDRREVLQKATYLHGEMESRAQRNAPLA
jgi:hypothetical protein